MTGPGSSPSTDPRQDDAEQYAVDCAVCGHAYGHHSAGGRCGVFDVVRASQGKQGKCQCEHFTREARS